MLKNRRNDMDKLLKDIARSLKDIADSLKKIERKISKEVIVSIDDMQTEGQKE